MDGLFGLLRGRGLSSPLFFAFNLKIDFKYLKLATDFDWPVSEVGVPES
jgi:hypothetical protein